MSVTGWARTGAAETRASVCGTVKGPPPGVLVTGAAHSLGALMTEASVIGADDGPPLGVLVTGAADGPLLGALVTGASV